MDASKSLPIRKHTTLLNRLPETRFATQLDKAKANWIVFAEYLSLAILKISTSSLVSITRC